MGFFSNYINTDREAVTNANKHKLYPIGQIMPIGAWGSSNRTASVMVNWINNTLGPNGYTFFGPKYAGLPEDEAYIAANNKNLRMVQRLYPGINAGYGEQCEHFDNGPLDEARIRRSMDDMDLTMSNNIANSITDCWLAPPEESVARMYYVKYTHLNCTAEKTIQHWKNKREAFSINDPQKRPILESELASDSPYSGLVSVGMHREGLIAQIYPEDRFRTGGEYPPSNIGGHPFRIAVYNMKKFVDANNEVRNTSTGRTREYSKGMAMILIGQINNIYGGTSSVNLWKEYFGYMIYSSFLHNMDAFMSYQQDTSTHDAINAAHSREACDWHVKNLTDLGLDQMSLWGQRLAYSHADSLKIAKNSGPTHANYIQNLSTGGSNVYNIKSLDYADIRFGTKRLLILTNNHWNQNVVAKINALPSNGYITNVITGNGQSISSFNNLITIAPEGYKVYLLAENPPGPPTTPTAPTFSANNVDPGDSVTLSSSTTGATSVQWQRKRSGGSWSNI